MNRPVNPSERIHWYYETYPENFNNFYVPGNNAAKRDSIRIPRAEFGKLMELSDFFYAMFDEIPKEDYELTRYQLAVSPEVFRWIPWVFNYYGVRVEDPIGIEYNINQVLLLKAKNIIRYIVDFMGFPEEPIANLYTRPRPRPVKNRTVRRNRYRNNTTNSNNSYNKSMRKANKKKAKQWNIRGMHPLEAKYY